MIRKILALCLLTLSTQAAAQGVLLSGTAPVVTRTSASDASPFTFTVNFNSAKFFAGYSEQIQVSTDPNFASVDKINLIKTLTEADFITPFQPNFASTADPAPADPSTLGSTYSNTACAAITCYVRVRGMARSPGGQYYFTAWSNSITNHDTPPATVFWNTSSQSPASSAGYTLSGTNGNTIATRTSLSGNQMVKSNLGYTGTGAVGKYATVKVTAGTMTTGVSIGLIPAGWSSADWPGGGYSGGPDIGVGIQPNGNVYKNGAVVLATGTTLSGGDTIKVIVVSGPKVCFQKNGTDVGSMNSTTGAGCISIASGTTYHIAASSPSTTSNPQFTINGEGTW